MNRYKFKAKDFRGNLVTGDVEAKNSSLAVKLLRQKGLIVISLNEIKGFRLNANRTNVGKSEIVSFTRQLATMINAGLPLTESLQILRAQSGDKMQKVVVRLLADVEEGMSFSAGLEKHPRVFSKTYVALIKSGEMGGVFDTVLAKLADNMEKQQEFNGKVKSAMVYPVIIIIGMISVAFIMLVFVVPRLTSLYDQFGAELPIATKILITVSGMLNKYWYLTFLGVFSIIYGFKLYKATPSGRLKIDGLLLNTPMIGGLVKQVILADFTRTLSLMVGSGVSIIDGLNISSEVVGNEVVSRTLKEASKLVEKGFPMTYAFSKNPEVFPFILSQMISVGEETGKMDEVLDKVSHVFEVESEQKLKMITSAVEPIILIVLGVGVAFLVVSIIMPIYNLTTQI